MEPKILPLVQTIGARFQTLNIDSRIINGFAEQGQRKGETFVYKRPAFKLYRALGAGIGRGMFNWQDHLYAIVNGTLFKDGAAIGAVNDSGRYSFAPTLGDTPKLFLHNATNGYFYDNTTLAPVVDSPFPASGPRTRGAVYLDATIYVMNQLKASIHGSLAAANNPEDWDALNVILAQIEPMKGVYLAKNLVYVLAIKEHYTEAFYDAGNPTGSPLSPVQGAKMNFGCYHPGTVRDVGGDLMWVGDSGEGYPTVVLVSNLKADVVSTPQVERILARTHNDTDGAFSSWNCRIAGHRLYGINYFGATIPPNPPFPPFTLVYDLTSRIWYHWTTSSGGALNYADSVQLGTETIFLHGTNGNQMCIDETVFKDEDDPGQFSFEIYTPNYDGDTRLQKVLNQMTILGDQTANTIFMRYSDDDYATWSSEFQFLMNLDRPDQPDLGAFTKRAFHFRHTANTGCRMESVEMNITGGVRP
jgi:hypothetical protein